MRLCLELVLFIVASLSVTCAGAQTLTEKLIGEDPFRLAESARKDGDIIRGAILYHQGNINCAKCHRRTAEADRFGPDLSQLNQDVGDNIIVESILEPSKKIKEGFETITALTTDGQLFHGLAVKNNSQKIVLRDNANIDRMITIDRDELDELRISKVSSMPAGLADQLKNRQQFLDLVRYVIDVKERGPIVDHDTSGSSTGRQLTPELNGLVLIHQLNCVACHQPDSVPGNVTGNQAPDLNWSAAWLNPRYMSRFIAEPQSIKPGTTMPQMLGHLDATTRKEVAEAITHYLVSTVDSTIELPPGQPIDGLAIARGAELFHAVGCVACHAPRNKFGVEQPLDESVPLGDLNQKYNVEGLVGFLEDPLSVRPSGRMPRMQLKHSEAVEIASYLLQEPDTTQTPWKTDFALARQGKELFSEFNCHACHSDPSGSELHPEGQLTLSQLNPHQGCLLTGGNTNEGERDGKLPVFHLTNRETDSIRAALRKYPSKLSNEQQIDVSLKSFNCIACHSRGDFGGVTAIRNPHFQTSNLNLGDQGRIPPTLTGVGSKLKSKWMRDVLVNGRVIRPYMKTRMPQFGEANVGHLAELFQNSDKLPKTVYAKFDDQKEMRELGLKIAGNKGLNCVACHTYKYKLSDTMPAVDLTEMSERLKKDWFYQYMLFPQKFSPNTVMPSFWPGGVAMRKDIAGDPPYQVEALWQYLIDGRQAGTPGGVVREPLEIIVTDEAQMLRRSYPGIGKRGIGVGYPGGVNLAFDAEQMRLGTIWRGKFVDPAGVWSGQGSGTVRTMGQPVNFARGPDLDDLANPWVVDDGRPPDHQFKGYDLDEFQRPTFRYVYDNVQVNDFFCEFTDDATQHIQLRRTITLTSADGHADLSFRVASGEDISANADGLYSIGNGLRVRIVSDQSATIADAADGKLLRISFDLPAGEQQNLTIEYFWK